MNDQSAAKPLNSIEYGESSETIPRGSRDINPETGGALTDNAEGKDIVRIKNKEDFIRKANIIHNNKFDYSEFTYVSAKTKSTIICPIHGRFEQNADKHFNSKFACPKCFKERPLKHAKKIRQKQFYVTKEIFLQRAYEKYGNLYEYDLSNYKSYETNKIKVKCREHGWFETLPSNHISKFVIIGCPKCGDILRIKHKTKSYDYVINQFNKLYDNYYTYPESNREVYKNKKSIIKIICPIHGVFEKKAQKHLIGQGCFRCRIDKLIDNGILCGGYSFDLFKEKPFLKDKIANLYYIEFNNGEYYKIGITTNLRSRLKGMKCDSKTSLKLILFKKSTLYDCFCLEQKILNDFLEFRTYEYEWSKELFSKNISNEIEKYFL